MTCATVTYLPTVTPQFSVSLAVSAAARTDGNDMRSAEDTCNRVCAWC